MKSFFVFFVLFSLNSWSDTIVNQASIRGNGLETLMNGVGISREGSHGALLSNPALLSSLPGKKEFISTNQLSVYNFHKEQNGQEQKISPEVVPTYAVTSEGFGNWGHGYGLSVYSFKIGSSGTTDGDSVDALIEMKKIELSYGFGLLWNGISYGATITLARITQELNVNTQGESAGSKYLGNQKYDLSFWHGSAILGVAKKFSTWSVGLSSRFNFFNLGADAKQQDTKLDASTNTIEQKSVSDLPSIVNVYNLGAGFQKHIGNHRLYFDMIYTPSYSVDEVQKGYSDSRIDYLTGWELELSEKYSAYSGFAYFPGDTKGLKDSGAVSFGISQNGANSLFYAGVSWSREFSKADQEVIRLTLGTKFQY